MMTEKDTFDRLKYKIVRMDDMVIYFNHKGEMHREGGPAVVHDNGTKEWYLNGLQHRKDGPAVEYSTGSKVWWLNGKLHREGGPAVEWATGTKQWWLNGKRIE